MKVYIEENHSDYVSLFTLYNWEVTTRLRDADLICLTGGADVSPSLYRSPAHSTTHYSDMRDHVSLSLFDFSQKFCVPIIGVCRGGQFLHVMAGGTLWQDVTDHSLPLGETHTAFLKGSGERLEVTSTHHQMMRGIDCGELLMASYDISRLKEAPIDSTTTVFSGISTKKTCVDVESMYYEKINAVSFQPHPEHYSITKGKSLKRMADVFFEFINKKLLGE